MHQKVIELNMRFNEEYDEVMYDAPKGEGVSIMGELQGYPVIGTVSPKMARKLEKLQKKGKEKRVKK